MCKGVKFHPRILYPSLVFRGEGTVKMFGHMSCHAKRNRVAGFYPAKDVRNILMWNPRVLTLVLHWGSP